MNPFIIERATVSDIPTIQALAHQIWPVAYASIITTDQITYMLNKMYDTNELERQIKEGVFFHICSFDNLAIGFCSVGQIAAKEFKLHKIYVLQNKQHSGAGKKLLENAKEIALAQGAESLILQVNRRNPSVGFYKKMGFDILEEKVFDFGDGFVMDDYVMGTKLF